MQIVAIRDPGEWKRVRPDWDAAYAADPHAEVFVSWPWLDSWRRIAPDPWVVLAARPEGAERFVGFLPLALRRSGPRGVIRELHMAGKPFAPLTGFVAPPAHSGPALDAFAAHLRDRLAWDALHLAEVIDPRLERFLEGFARPGFRVRRGAPLCCPLLPLPESWDAYLASWDSAKRRKRMRYLLRHVEGVDGYRTTRPRSDSVAAEIDVLLDLWETRWGPMPASERDRYRHMYGTAFHEGRLFMRTMWSGDEPIASLAAFLDPVKKSVSYYTSGFAPAWSAWSPGKAIVGHCIREAIEEKFDAFDFLVGGHDYKLDFFGARERFASSAVVVRDSLRGTIGRGLAAATRELRSRARRVVRGRG